MIYLLVIFRFISSVVLTIHISTFNASFIYFTQYRLLRMCGSLFCERRPTRINERKPLSARRHLVNPSPQAKDELSVRCEDERSGSVVFGFILAGLLPPKAEAATHRATALFSTPELLAFLLVLALLICNTTAGLASGLAGGLALAASAVLNGLCNIFGFNSLNSVHWYYLQDY